MIKNMKLTLGIVLLVGLSACSSTSKKTDGPNLKKAAEFNVQLGASYITQNKIQLAKDKLEKALEQDPDNALAHSTMALLLEKVGQFEEVESHYEEAIELDPKNSDIKQNYGTYLCNRGRYADANAQFEIALKDPYYKTPIVAITNAGSCAFDNKQYKEAEAYFRKALRINPNAAHALFLMGKLGLQTKRYLMSRAYMQRYHAVALSSPKSLWIQIQAEKALGDKNTMAELIQQLNKKFPDSDESGEAMRLVR